MVLEMMSVLAMVCATTDHIGRRGQQAQANCIAYLLEHCPADKDDKLGYIDCLKNAAQAAKKREFEK